ncbi:hypothetical protein, partial [Lacrimispora amygdalina]|uniref:hypothetical protein n=1 Tax=Lacrimispora amygdalina TaxID=253257 RepID=UPI00196BA61F
MTELTVEIGTEEPNLPHTLRAVVALELEEEDMVAEQIQPSIPASELEPAEQQAGEQSEPAEPEEFDHEPVESPDLEEPESEPVESAEPE